jgi:hypothetical protein
MSVGVMLSAIVSVLLGNRLARFQLIATVSLILGAILYLTSLRAQSPIKTIQGILAAALYTIGVVLVVFDLL